MPFTSWALIPLGLIVGAYGTLIGVGGGFILVPILLFLYPRESPETITSISLAVVCCNALSGSIAYGRLKRINYKAGITFAAATLPGAILGSLTTSWLPRRSFDIIFGFLMLVVSVALLLNPGPTKPLAVKVGDRFSEHVRENNATRRASKHRLLGLSLSSLLGYISNLLGIGAGFLFVPALVYFLRFPVRVATATSQFILGITAFAGTATHIAAGLFHHGIRRTIFLAIGVIIGAQLGARLSVGIKENWIIRSLAVALALVGIRLLF